MKDLPTLQDLFNNAVFKIPDYQRGYSWENQHRLDLLEDLELINNKGHYTGTIVLKERDTVKGLGKIYTRYDIVDGQQRFTTILILLDTIIKELKKLDEEESSAVADGISSIYIKDKGPTGMNIYKLELDKENDKYFQEAIIEGAPGINRTIKSHNNLYNAQKQFETYLLNKSLVEENYLQCLYSLVDKLTQSLIFTLYNVEDDAEVGVIFEVMNDRGKPLSELEKVKNYLIYLSGKISEDSQSSSKMVETINNDWKSILENLAKSDMSRNDDEDRFLRMNYIINFYSDLKAYKQDGKKISKTGQLAHVYKNLKTYFKDLERGREYERCYKEIGDYANSLQTISTRLLDILDPYDKYAFQTIENKKLRADIQSIVSKIGRMDIKSNILVLMVAIYDRFIEEPEKIIKLMDICEKFAFRTYYLIEWRSYSGQNQIYTLACDIYNDRLNYHEIIAVMDELFDYYAADSIVANNFFNRDNYYDWKGLKYFLFEYEVSKCWENLKSDPQLTWSYLKKTDRKDSIEHILPQSLERNGKKVPYWKERFNKKAHEENLHKLGNLTLTTASENSKLSNKGFDEKKPIFKESDWKINQMLAHSIEWNETKILKRGKDLFEFALKRWGY
ncbi:MAG: DUF262 domain-containing HNH endonuclease family protein [Methanobacteriaceae archaeon]|nr:DUF262 domain-containing HNH endonuclease family protein [Methanobacteriaceae archaeon]